MTATILRADARHLPLADGSVDLICTSPPYYALRSYTDNGQHYDGQIGAEPTPQQYINNLIACTREWMRVLKPGGSIFVNLGDKFSDGQRYDNNFTAEDAAWLAGVIDSDGSISIRADNSGRSHIAWTRIGQMRREVVERVGAVTGTGQVWQDKRGVWNWNAAAQQARWVLERIWPWLHIKRRQALAAVDLMTRKAAVGGKGRWNPLTDTEIGYRETIRQAVLAWNRGEEFPDYEPPVLPLPAIPAEPRWIPAKSLLLLPERYRVACVDELGLFARSVIIWSKVNGLPESVTDRVRRSHEDWVHLTKQPRYYAAVDEIRTPHAGKPQRRLTPHFAGALGNQARDGGWKGQLRDEVTHDGNPLGALPGSVWEIPTEPLQVPAHLGVDHFAAYPMEWPRRIILGWSPSGICTACGEGRRPVADRQRIATQATNQDRPDNWTMAATWAAGRNGRSRAEVSITGEACACTPSYLTGGDNADHLADWRPPPTRPAIVLDPFGGTGTTALVAHALGRHGITVDRSADYNRLAQWRTSDPDQMAKAMRVEKPPKQLDGQLGMFDLGGVG